MRAYPCALRPFNFTDLAILLTVKVVVLHETIIEPQTNFTVRIVPEPHTQTRTSAPRRTALYLQRSSWRFCRGLLRTPWTPMSPAGPRRCSWPVCHPGSLGPRAGRRSTAARRSPTSSSLGAQSTVRTALPTGQPVSDLKSLKVWPCAVYSAFHTHTSLSLPIYKPPPKIPSDKEPFFQAL